MASRFNYFINQSKSQDIHSVLSYWDKKLNCKFANYETVNWFGIKPSELAGKNKLKVLLGKDYDLHVPYIEEVFNGKSQVFEYEKSFISTENQPVIATYFPDIELGAVVGFFLHLSLKGDKNEGSSLSLSNSFHQSLESNNKIPQVINYLKSQLFIGFPKLEYLAKLHLISVSKLMRDFKKQHDTSPFLFFRSLQMEFASKHIKNAMYSKKQLALMLGFSNPANFTSCYNKWLKDQQVVDLTKKPYLTAREDKLNYFIAQLPISVAMLDRQLNFVQVSEKWVSDFSLNHTVTNRRIFDYFPDKSFKWRKMLVECLGGRSRKKQYDLFKFDNGDSYLLNWEIKPCHDSEKNIVGLIIYTTILEHVSECQQVYFDRQ